MSRKQTIWIHPASLTYRFDEPANLMETIWAQRSGWGYLKRSDLWTKKEAHLQDLLAAGYKPRKSQTDEDVAVCPSCGMYMDAIPGSLVSRHKSECGGYGENWQAIEETLINDVRMKRYEAKIAEQKRREQEELEEAERRERQDKIKEGLLARQLQKDRKRRLKQETKEEWKNR